MSSFTLFCIYMGSAYLAGVVACLLPIPVPLQSIFAGVGTYFLGLLMSSAIRVLDRE